MLYSYATSSVGTPVLLGVGVADVASSGANGAYVVQNPPPARLVLLSRMTNATLDLSAVDIPASAVPVWPAPQPDATTPVFVGSPLCATIASAMPPGPWKNGTTCCVP